MNFKIFTSSALCISSLFLISVTATAQWVLPGNNLVGGEKLGSLNNQPVNIVTNNTSRIWVTPTGSVGIGTTAPGSILSLGTAIQSNKFYIYDNPATANKFGFGLAPGVFQMYAGSISTQRIGFGSYSGGVFSERVTFANDGKVGIGTISPNTSALLDVTSTTNGVLFPRMTAAQKNAIVSPATGLLIYQTDAAAGFYYYNAGWQFLSSSGANTGLSNLTAPTAVNVHLLPAPTATRDLGSAANNWRNLFLSGDANLSAGNLNFSSSLQTIQFPTVPTTTSNPMINMFSGGTQNKDRMVIAHSPSYTNWGLQYQDSLDKFNFLSGGTPVLTTDLGSWRVGVGTSSPATRFDIAGTGAFNLASSEGDFRLGNATYRLKMGVANAGGGAGDAYIASSHRLYLGAGTTLGRTQTMSINNNGRVGIGTFSPSARLEVVGDTLTIPVIEATTAYAGNAHVRGISSTSVPADGWGYGIYSTGGYRGGYFVADGGASAGTAAGVQGFASGAGGSRYGVYGSASGGTENWGGYFPTKTYTNELRVGTLNGATGYLVSVGGRLIAEEVRVELEASWPDYVFNKGYKLMSLEELEAKINIEKHLPGVPSADEVKENGIMLGEMQTKTIEKVEENTLYIIQLNNKIKQLEKIIEELSKKVK